MNTRLCETCLTKTGDVVVIFEGEETCRKCGSKSEVILTRREITTIIKERRL